MSQFMQDLASRQLASPTTASIPHRPNHREVPIVNEAAAQSQPSSSCNTSLGSTHSKQSHDSDTNSTALSANSKASSTLRSPPPKRTREGRVLEQEHDSMLIEHQEAHGSLMTQDDDEDTHEADYGSDGRHQVVVNLESRFGGAHVQHAPAASSSTLRSSSAMYQQSSGTPTPSQAAPLDSQYTSSPGPDGAGGK